MCLNTGKPIRDRTDKRLNSCTSYLEPCVLTAQSVKSTQLVVQATLITSWSFSYSCKLWLMTCEVTACALVDTVTSPTCLILTSEFKLSSLLRNFNNNEHVRIYVYYTAANDGITIHNKRDKILISSVIRWMQLLFAVAPGVSSGNATWLTLREDSITWRN